MMLTIILTSYNRPRLVRRALDSLAIQRGGGWQCILQDDGSNATTLRALYDLTEHTKNIWFVPHMTPDVQRATTCRYGVLINEALARVGAWDGVVGYMCDNVEYYADLAQTVLAWFDAYPKRFSGYVEHERDWWAEDGSKRLGKASDIGHWDKTPPVSFPKVVRPAGVLDHSQVFHRLPCEVRWPEEARHKKRGDAMFFTRLVAAHGPIWAIAPGKTLTVEHLVR